MIWYEGDVKQLEVKEKQLIQQPETIFYGSSSIRQWASLENDFKEYKATNLGFGGSTLAACVWFFDRLMAELQPKRLIVYAGDNDLADGRHPEEIFIFFQQLVARSNNRFGTMPCYFISAKPSPSRWHLVEQFKLTNKLIEQEIFEHCPNWKFINLFNEMIGEDGMPRKDFFQTDSLHLNSLGYQMWTRVIKQTLQAEA